jgi:hypothetical protein
MRRREEEKKMKTEPIKTERRARKKLNYGSLPDLHSHNETVGKGIFYENKSAKRISLH